MKFILNCLLCTMGFGIADPPPDPVWVERQTYVMGTVLRAEAEGADREHALTALEAALAEVRRIESVWSSWDSTSEIGRINSAEPGTRLAISPELVRVLDEVVEWGTRTSGAFDPAVGALIDAWGLRDEGRQPSPEALGRAVAASGIDRFAIDAGGGVVVRTSAAAWLDTGGFGKGLALREAGRILMEAGIERAMLDFGGQVLVLGDGDVAGRAMRIDIAHPADREASAGWVEVDAGSVATSGQSERFIEVNGDRFGHIVDPRTGMPVRAWGSVTVVAEDPMVADILSTALFVMGPDEGREWAAGLDEVGVLFLENGEDGVEASWNGHFAQFNFHVVTNQESNFR